MGRLAKFVAGYETEKRTIAKTFRTKRIKPFAEMVAKVHARNGAVRVLDIGGTSHYWRILEDGFFDRHNLKVTLLNLPGSTPQPRQPGFETVSADATTDIWHEIEMDGFDLIHSNSVVEHVGDWDKMVQFATNIKTFKGGYFVQTPNFWFPIEPHCLTPFFHWLPKRWRLWLVQNFTLGHWPKAQNRAQAIEIVESARLLNSSQFALLFEDAEIEKEKAFFLTKSFVAIRHIST